MISFLHYTPGQEVTIYLEILNSDGYRFDGYVDGYAPVVNRIIKPDLSLMTDGYYPKTMSKIDIGLYRYKFTLPTGSVAVGSYLIDVSYKSSVTLQLKQQLYQIIVNAPFGNYGLITG
jgi:hypothetical protein